MVEPEYWWECLVIQCNIWGVMCALLYATNTPAIMNLDRLYVWWKSFAITYVIGYLLGCVATFILFTIIWVYVIKLRHPIPLGGIINQMLGLFTMIISLWFQMPNSWRKVESFKKHAKWVMVFHFVGMAISASYWVLWTIMDKIPEEYQPIMAVVFPLFREGLVEILKMIGSHSTFFYHSWFQPCIFPACRSSGKVSASVELQVNQNVFRIENQELQ